MCTLFSPLCMYYSDTNVKMCFDIMWGRCLNILVSVSALILFGMGVRCSLLVFLAIRLTRTKSQNQAISRREELLIGMG